LSSNNALLAKANGFSLHAGVLFFPAAAVHAELLLPLSVSGRVGRLSLVLAANARELHAGEMVFGFATAVIAVMGATILLQVAGGRWQVADGDRVAVMTRKMQGSAFGTTLGLLWQCLAFKEFHGPGVIHTEVALP